MFTFYINKTGNVHMIDYSFNGMHRAVCGETVSKFECINTFASDNTFNIGCRNCFEIYRMFYISSLNKDIRFMRSSFFRKMKNLPQIKRAKIPRILKNRKLTMSKFQSYLNR